MQTSENIAQVASFAERVFTFFSHAAGHDDLNTPGHMPDWKDSPARFRGYAEQATIPLPAPEVLFSRLQDQRSGEGSSPGAAEVNRLALLLYLAFAPLRRQLNLNWNHLHLKGLTTFRGQDFARGAASGGGLYPTQCYLFEGGGTALRPGLYHYSNGTHGFTPLRPGDVTGELAEALGNCDVHTRYLVLTSDFWRNCFKYNNFGYHVCTQDIGAAVGMLEAGAEALGVPLRLHLEFRGENVDALLGVDGVQESAFAVVALGELAHARALPDELGRQRGAVPQPWQRSKRVALPAELKAVHRCAAPTPAGRAQAHEAPSRPVCGVGSTVEAPSPSSRVQALMRQSLVQVLHRRRSSWSSMSGASPMPLMYLLDVLRYMQAEPAGGVRLGHVRLCLKISDVADVSAGAYDWDAKLETLVPRSIEPVATWQHTYAMDNYNVDEAAAVLFVIADLASALAQVGASGYRLLNMAIGRLAQRAYLGAAALDLAAGAVLGVRASALKRILQLSEAENVFLAIYLGPAQPRVELFDFRLIGEGTLPRKEAV